MKGNFITSVLARLQADYICSREVCFYICNAQLLVCYIKIIKYYLNNKTGCCISGQTNIEINSETLSIKTSDINVMTSTNRYFEKCTTKHNPKPLTHEF